jgi:hypothetical protein
MTAAPPPRSSVGGGRGSSRVLFLAAVASFSGAALGPAIVRAVARAETRARLDGLAASSGACGRPIDVAAVASRRARLGAVLASWQTVGGCGAGSATGIGGVKWIGRGVRGGLFSVQCQGNYTRFGNGYSFSLQNQITTDVSEKWNLGVVVPYLYKYLNDPYGLRFDLSNQGLGDVNGLVTRRFGPINATSVTLSVGFPTGTSGAEYEGNQLPQDRQLGAGEISGALLVDHTMDNLWGPVVLGGVVSYPGQENESQNYRSPSGTLYGYAGYLLGPLVPALGVSATGFLTKDRDRGQENPDRPPYLAAVNASLEFSTDWVAFLAGFSLPFSTGGLQPWTAGLGFSFAPF